MVKAVRTFQDSLGTSGFLVSRDQKKCRNPNEAPGSHRTGCRNYRLESVIQLFFQRKRLRRGDGAKSARPRATVARDHKSGRALTPAFPPVRALCTLANGVQSQIGNERFGRKENR